MALCSMILNWRIYNGAFLVKEKCRDAWPWVSALDDLVKAPTRLIKIDFGKKMPRTWHGIRLKYKRLSQKARGATRGKSP